MTGQDAATRADAQRLLNFYKAGEFLGITQDRQVIDLMVAFADETVKERDDKIRELTFADETGHSSKMSIAEWIAYWRKQAAEARAIRDQHWLVELETARRIAREELAQAVKACEDHQEVLRWRLRQVGNEARREEREMLTRIADAKDSMEWWADLDRLLNHPPATPEGTGGEK